MLMLYFYQSFYKKREELARQKDLILHDNFEAQTLKTLQMKSTLYKRDRTMAGEKRSLMYNLRSYLLVSENENVKKAHPARMNIHQSQRDAAQYNLIKLRMMLSI